MHSAKKASFAQWWQLAPTQGLWDNDEMSLRTQLRLFLLMTLVSALPSVNSVLGAEDRHPFRFRLAFEPSTLDWTLGDIPILVTLNTMRGLFRVDEKGKVVPDLARSSRHDPGLRVWTFEIQPGLKWSDGVPLTARHIADGLRRLTDPRTASSYSYFLKDLEEVRETSPLRVEVRLKSPVAQLPAILSHWVTFPVRMDLVEKYRDYGTKPGHMAFLGPYQIENWKDSRISLTRNPHAENSFAPPLIEAVIVNDDETAVNLYRAGKLDFLADPGPSGHGNPDLRTQTSPILYFIAVTANHPITRNPKALRALSLALERKEIPQLMGVGHRAASDFCPPEILGEFSPSSHAASIAGHEQSPRRLLSEAGFTDPEKLPPLTLMYFERPSIRDLAQWIQAQWKTKLGISASIDSTDIKSYWALMKKNPAPLFLNSKGASYPDPDAFFRLFASGNPQNMGHWSDPDYDSWIQKASASSSPKLRLKLYSQAQERVTREKPALIPLYFRSTQYLIKPYVHGLTVNPLTGVDFRTIRLEEGP